MVPPLPPKKKDKKRRQKQPKQNIQNKTTKNTNNKTKEMILTQKGARPSSSFVSSSKSLYTLCNSQILNALQS